MGDLAGRSEPQTIHVTLLVAPSAAFGTTLLSTAGIASDTSEIEQANNTAQWTTFVGYRIYMPVVPR